MVREFHIVTVGAGILLNYKRFGEKEIIERYGVNKWVELAPDDEEQQVVEKYARRNTRVFKKVLEFVSSDPKRASPELNAFISFYHTLSRANKNDVELSLYTTDTGVGLFCGRILYEYLCRQGFKVNSVSKLRKYGWGPEFFDEALLDMVDKFSREIAEKRKEGVKVYVNATGGFKPETAFTVITALLMEVDGVYYIHEYFREITLLPAIPLSIKESYFKVLRELEDEPPVWMARQLLEKHFPGALNPLDDLKRRGLVDTVDDRVILRKWVKKLVEILSV
ncbi:MAG: hypothetical protein DRJ47_10185 [Thermoprotei archaeon]|nr:MAG: hypothetical protein DRJ47_10185 [Thermoprotei archaeon]